MSSLPTSRLQLPALRLSLTEYAAVAVNIAMFSIFIGVIASGPVTEVPADAIYRPVATLLALTAAVLVATGALRVHALVRGLVSGRYYRDYRDDAGPDWIERPARTFNNLMQVPTLFYLACLFLLQRGEANTTQLALAWIFVGLRIAHAVIYIGWNYVPARFTTYTMSVIALGVLWACVLA